MRWTFEDVARGGTPGSAFAPGPTKSAAEARNRSATGTANARDLLMPPPAVPVAEASKPLRGDHEGFLTKQAA
jgi:hypothetical protein